MLQPLHFGDSGKDIEDLELKRKAERKEYRFGAKVPVSPFQSAQMPKLHHFIKYTLSFLQAFNSVLVINFTLEY